jgi:hypothetical protein
MGKTAPALRGLFVAAGLLVTASLSAQGFGVLDTPRANQTVSGIVRASGWVLSSVSTQSVDILVDGVVVNSADLSLPRADVLEAFPTYAGSPTTHPGFASAFLARNFTNGPHTFEIRVTESNGHVFSLGPFTLIVDNNLNQAPFGYIDQPGAAGIEGFNGSFPVVGWAIDDFDIDHINFKIDGQIVAGAVGRGEVGTAVYGTPRPDIAAAFPDVPMAMYSGFGANIDSTDLVNGMHVLSVDAIDDDGASREIGRRTVQVINNGDNLGPFGRIDYPLDEATLQCTRLSVAFPSPCTPEICAPTALQNIVNGWALDVGSRLDRGQVAYVELLLDGQIIANTRSDCVQFGQTLVNCYGVNRPDVAQNYPHHVNADNAGFRFAFALFRELNVTSNVLFVGIPLADGSFLGTGATVPGKHTLSLRAGDDESTVTQFAAMSVNILCDVASEDFPGIGFIDNPRNYEFIGGTWTFSGWAFDQDGIRVTAGVEDGIEIFIDGQLVAKTNNNTLRPDVPLNEPRVTSSFTGWSIVYDTTQLSDAEHDLTVYVVDNAFGGNRRTLIGRRKFVVNNNVPTHN